jgi:hypothetical protein
MTVSARRSTARRGKLLHSQTLDRHLPDLQHIGFLQSAMGLANAQRTLDYLAALAEFCTRDGVRRCWREAVTAFSQPVQLT